MRAIHARVHDVRNRIAQQETIIELRVPIEHFSAIVETLHERDVLVVTTTEMGGNYGQYGPIDAADGIG